MIGQNQLLISFFFFYLVKFTCEARLHNILFWEKFSLFLFVLVHWHFFFLVLSINYIVCDVYVLNKKNNFFASQVNVFLTGILTKYWLGKWVFTVSPVYELVKMWYEGWLSSHTSLVSAQFRFRVIIVTFDLSQHTVWTSVSLLFLAIQWSGSDNGPSWTCTGPNWSQPSAFYCLYNSSPVEGLHSKLWNELERTMWVTTMKANRGHFVRWGKQPICMVTDHHIWTLELMSMWLNALFDHPEGIRNFPCNITDSISIF